MVKWPLLMDATVNFVHILRTGHEATAAELEEYRRHSRKIGRRFTRRPTGKPTGEEHLPRTLKTFVTNLGFFELAIAAPSMKAALKAWGMSHNAFQYGSAQQSDDPKVIAATTAKPGVILKRAVGSKGEFREDAELPKTLPNVMPPKVEAPKPKSRKSSSAKPSKKAKRADIISFEKARAKRDKERAVEEARVKKDRASHQRATDRAEAALERSRDRHEKELELIEGEQEKLDRRAKKERERWEAERKRLEATVDRAKK